MFARQKDLYYQTWSLLLHPSWEVLCKRERNSGVKSCRYWEQAETFPNSVGVWVHPGNYLFFTWWSSKPMTATRNHSGAVYLTIVWNGQIRTDLASLCDSRGRNAEKPLIKPHSSVCVQLFTMACSEGYGKLRQQTITSVAERGWCYWWTNQAFHRDWTTTKPRIPDTRELASTSSPENGACFILALYKNTLY